MSSTEHLDGLSLALNDRRPLVLLLGQDAWRIGSHPDPILIAALKRSQRYSEEMAASFPFLLNHESLDEGFYDWLADIYTHQPIAQWMETVVRLPLNAVFTTSIDPSLNRAFRSIDRDVEAVLSNFDKPAAPRHRRNLHITYLFGRAGEKNIDETPPKNTRELLQRTSKHTNPLLSRIEETTTSLGMLLIDGLSCGRDWLKSDVLYGILSSFLPGQVYWFGWEPDGNLNLEDRELFQDLAYPKGPIVFVRERLSTALQSLELAHKIDIRTRQFTGENSITIGDRVFELDPAICLKTSTGASIVDDTWLEPLPQLGQEAFYIEFRRFHGQIEDGRRLIEGICRGFAIERAFEQKLRNFVDEAFTKVGRSNSEPILIHGQSGSGKSIALARLAYNVRKERKYPVLFASRVMRVPAVNELDEFCQRAEKVGATATLLVCDANAPASRYQELLRGFLSRGRQVVIVGSTYRIIDNEDNGKPSVDKHLLEIPTILNESELRALADLFGSQTGFNAKSSEYLLPAIYRMLPDARPRLAAGLAREAQTIEDDLRGRGAHKATAAKKNVSALGQALIEAGLVNPKTILEQKIEDFLGKISDSASKAIDFVMVSGKLDCRVPINLLMRAVGGSENPIDIIKLFSGIDLFRWVVNDEDDVFICPRLKVEAELISARRLGNSQAEAEIAIELLASANPVNGSCERRFVLDLVHRLGPDGPFGRRYVNNYLEIARILTEIRNKRGITDPSLMLQEATLRRRILRDAQNLPNIDTASVLEEAREIVDLALNEFNDSKSRGLRHVCANLKVERAAIYSFRALECLRSGANQDEVWNFYQAARESARSAIFAAETYFAIDISIWGPDDLLRGCDWDPEKRAELIADIWDGLERVDSDQLDWDQRERFETRRAKVGQTLNDKQLQQEALDKLDMLGSKAGVLLKARAIGGQLWGTGLADENDVSKAISAVAFIKEHWDKVHDDTRCLRYFLRALWIVSTKSYLFGGERSPIPYRDDELNEILGVLELLSGIDGALGDPKIQYLRAVIMWRLRRENPARELWQSISQETNYSDPRRIVRHHLWTELSGQPKLFYGRITNENVGQGRVLVEVDEIRQKVELLERDFPRIDLQHGAGIPGGFYIAFNYIGPVAEPVRRGGGR